MSKSVYYYSPLPKNDTAIETALQQKAEEHSEEGFWMAYERLRHEGKPWNHKRVYRVYKKLGLSFKNSIENFKKPKRIPASQQSKETNPKNPWKFH